MQTTPPLPAVRSPEKPGKSKAGHARSIAALARRIQKLKEEQIRQSLPPRVAIYTRVSTEDQTNSPQKIELLKIAEFRGWTVAHEISDTQSGASVERPGLDFLMNLVRTKQIDIILVVKVDRLGRSLKHLVGVIEEIHDAGIALVAPGQGIDTTSKTAASEFQLNILAAVSQFERAMISERTKAGLVAARARGRKLGKPSPVMIRNPSAVVDRWAKEGWTYRELARRLGGVSVSAAYKMAKAKARRVVDAK